MNTPPLLMYSAVNQDFAYIVMIYIAKYIMQFFFKLNISFLIPFFFHPMSSFKSGSRYRLTHNRNPDKLFTCIQVSQNKDQGLYTFMKPGYEFH